MPVYNKIHIAGRGLVVRQLRLSAAGRDSRFAVPCPPTGGHERSPKSAPTTYTNL